MALAPVPIPQFPSVPRAPGVPALLRGSTTISNSVLVLSDVASILKRFLGPRWGIFRPSGEPLLIGDSVLGVGLKKDHRIAHHPVERGGFASYNKVELPLDARAVFTVSGSDAKRTAFMASVVAAAASTDLVVLVMPEFSYRSLNITHYDSERRTRDGVTLLKVEVWLEEVRTSVSTKFVQTQAPSGAAVQNGGIVQTALPSPVQSQAAGAAR